MAPDPWRREEFLASLTAASSNTVAAYGRDLVGFVTWAERLELARPGGGRPPGPAPLPRLPGHPQLRQAHRRPQGLGPAPLLRVAPAHRRARGRPVGGAVAPRRATAACPGSCATTSSPSCSTSPAPSSTDDPAPIRLRDDAVLELLYGSGLRVAELCGLRPERPRPRRAARSRVWGKGSKQRQVPLSEPAVEAVRGWLDRGSAGARHRPRRRPTRCSSTGGSTRSDPVTSGASSTVARPRRPTPTPCATPSPPTCSTGVPTCGRCRRCSATPTSARRSTTLTSPRNGSARVLDATHPRA